MATVIAIIAIVIAILQSSRLTKLETMVKKLSSGMPEKEKAPAATVQTPAPQTGSPAPASPVMAAPTISLEQSRDGSARGLGGATSSEEMSGKILGRIGIAALVIGVGFFLKYAFDNNWVGPAGRVMIGILIGIFLLALGQWLRRKYLGYSDLLMGGGLAVLYLSVVAAEFLYQLIDPMAAFLGLIVVTAIGVILSLMNATQTLAIIAFIGGFLAPTVIGIRIIGPWVTFTYITVLNLGVLAILAYKKWNPLIIIGLIGSWLIFGSWLGIEYKEDLLVPVMVFLTIQFLIFTAAAVVRLIVEKAKASELDFFLLGITAMSYAAGCYYLLMPEYKDFTALWAVLVAVLYGAIALVAYKENPSDKTINVFLPGLSVAFLTAAIAIEFEGEWVAAWWFIEALVLYIVASKSSSRGFQVMGVVVYILGLMKTLWFVFERGIPNDYVIFFNPSFAMLVMALLTAYAIAFVYYRYGSVSTEIQKRGIGAFVILANVLTVFAFTMEINAYYALLLRQVNYGVQYENIKNTANTVISIAWALYAALLTILGFAKKYAVVRRMGLVLFILTGAKVVIDVWNLGEIYRVISFVVFGVIALAASFMYVKYKDRLKEIV